MPIVSADKDTLQSFVKSHIAADAMSYTDEHPFYEGLLNHEALQHSQKEYVRVYNCHGEGQCPEHEPYTPEEGEHQRD